ncbi:Acetyltransferase [Drechslerella dactyloides]|uniref:Acetyltransferase n=1 Tax=Drechslerella dactyloides TaxID=74499 RepID=A0AAD6J6E9_DREDA|nr:Acetyltransferase [Drechslerella dactyloides]
MPLFPSSSLTPYALYPTRLSTLATTTPILLHEAFFPLLLLFLTLLLHPEKSPLRNAIALPVIVGLYARLVALYSSSHWGFAFCVGAYAYYGSLQAFNLLVVKDVARDPDVKWSVDDTGVAATNGHAYTHNGHGNGTTGLRDMNGDEKHSNGSANGSANGGTYEDRDKHTANGSSSRLGNGVANGGSHGVSNGTAGGKVSIEDGLGYPAISSYPLKQRIRFTWSLLFASRGVGWKFQIRHIPPAPSPDTSFVSFLQTHASKICISYVILESFSFIAAIDPYFTTPVCWTTPFHPTTLPDDEYYALCLPGFVPVNPAAIPFLWHHVFRKYLGLFSVYAILTQLFSIAALLFTTLVPLTRPEGWVPLFGSPADMTSLRGFWTKFWHSIFKKYFSYPGEWIAFHLLQLDRRSAGAQIIVMIAAFANSGALHGVGCYTLNRRWKSAAGFFLLQPVGFLGEIALFKALKAAGVDSKGVLGKTITTIYSTTWLLWCSEVFAYDFLHGGISVAEPVALSFWRWLAGQQAWRWDRPDEWLRWDREGSLGGWGVRL